MKHIEPDLSKEDATPNLGSTGPAPGDTEETRSLSNVEKAGETDEMTPEPETAHSAGAGEECLSPFDSLGKTESLEILDQRTTPSGACPQRRLKTLQPATPGAAPSHSRSIRSGTASGPNPAGPGYPRKIDHASPATRSSGVLGEGGMGIVYKARQVRLDRFVALKMIRAGTGARPQDLARFEAEAQAVAAIEHPNIVRIFEIGEHGGMPYCSLEYLSGGSLAKKIGGKPRPADEAARIVATLASAMEVAHKRGIVHRDFKPANVLIAADGTLKITDFGLVKRLEDDSSQTRTGSILGTPSYMSPEQAKGETTRSGPPPTSMPWARSSTSS